MEPLEHICSEPTSRKQESSQRLKKLIPCTVWRLTFRWVPKSMQVPRPTPAKLKHFSPQICTVGCKTSRISLPMDDDKLHTAKFPLHVRRRVLLRTAYCPATNPCPPRPKDIRHPKTHSFTLFLFAELSSSTNP